MTTREASKTAKESIPTKEKNNKMHIMYVFFKVSIHV